jgi:hypothetical protein
MVCLVHRTSRIVGMHHRKMELSIITMVAIFNCEDEKTVRHEDLYNAYSTPPALGRQTCGTAAYSISFGTTR